MHFGCVFQFPNDQPLPSPRRISAESSGSLLIGLFRTEYSIASDTLNSYDVSLVRLRTAWEKFTPARPESAVSHSREIPFADRMEKSLERAMGEAKQLGHNYIGTEHLLLGLLRDEAASGLMMLRSLELEPKQIRQQVLERCGAIEKEGAE